MTGGTSNLGGSTGGLPGFGGTLLGGTGGVVAFGGSGGAVTGGVPTGGATAGGTGGDLAGGTGGNELLGGAGTGGTAPSGGAAGTTMGGAGGAGGDGCLPAVLLHVPLDTAEASQQFAIDLGADVDMSATVISVTFQITTAGHPDASGIQFFAKNSAYDTEYLVPQEDVSDSPTPWISLSSALETATFTFDASQVSFANAVRFIGIQVSAGSEWDGATWGDTTVQIDSITFSNGAVADIDFATDAGGLAVDYGDYGDTASVEYVPCATTGTGGAGGEGGIVGSGGAAGAGEGGRGGALPLAGAAGMFIVAGAAGMPAGDAGAAGQMGAGGAPVAGQGGVAGSIPGQGGVAGASVVGTGGVGGQGGSGSVIQNLIVNGDFESGTTSGWESWASTSQLSASSSPTHSGSWCLLVSNLTGSNRTVVQYVTDVVSVDNAYTMSAWVMTSVASELHFTVQYRCANDDEEYAWVQGATAVSTGGWTELTGPVEPSGHCAGSTITSVALYLEGMAEGTDVYLDDVVLVRD